MVKTHMIQRSTESRLAVVPADGREASPVGVSCSECGLREICLPQGLDGLDRAELDQCIRRRRPLGRREMLYVDGRPAHSLYAIRCGSIKTYAVSPDGEEFVQGFHLPGEVLGLESLAGDRHDHFAEALEPTLYCEISTRALEDLLPRMGPLRRQIMRIINERLRDGRRRCLMQNRKDACVRLAGFLQDLSRRRAESKLSPTPFRLSMDRRDIANYLGLTLETISRAFSRLQREGALEVRGKHVSVLEPELLAATFDGNSSRIASRRDERRRIARGAG